MRIWLAISALLCALSFGIASAEAFAPSELERLILERTNHERTLNGLQPLALHHNARDAARGHAVEMARLGYMDHYSPTQGRKTPPERMRQARVSSTIVGENVARREGGERVEEAARQILLQWMNSPLHRANILHPDYTHLGVGVGRGNFEGRETIFVAQNFLQVVALDLRLFIQGSDARSIHLRMSGTITRKGNFVILWQEHGTVKQQFIGRDTGAFHVTFPVANNAGRVQVSLGMETGNRTFMLTDIFYVDTVRQIVEPPPY